MGMKGGGSWLTAVKRAFRSPFKDKDDEEKKRSEKRRWLFRESASHDQPQLRPAAAAAPAAVTSEQWHAIALAVATAATAAAAVATAQAAAEVVRLTMAESWVRQAALRCGGNTDLLQARRVLSVLKGLVKAAVAGAHLCGSAVLDLLGMRGFGKNNYTSRRKVCRRARRGERRRGSGRARSGGSGGAAVVQGGVAAE